MPGQVLQTDETSCSQLDHNNPACGGTSTTVQPKERYRVVLMGGARVGKTCLITRFLYDHFAATYKATVEEMHSGEYDTLGDDGGSGHLILDILDTSGAYSFPAMRDLSIGQADAFILVFAVDDAGSFDEVRDLREQILRVRRASFHHRRSTIPPIVVVGNKIDVGKDCRQVACETAETIVCIDWEHGYVESSAKDNVNVSDIFKELLNLINVKVDFPPPSENRRVSLPVTGSTSTCGKQKLMKRHSCSLS